MWRPACRFRCQPILQLGRPSKYSLPALICRFSAQTPFRPCAGFSKFNSVKFVALSRKSGQTICRLWQQVSGSTRRLAAIGFPELRCTPGLIKVPKNEAEKHFAAGGALIFHFGRTRGHPRRFKDRDGLLYAVVHCQTL